MLIASAASGLWRRLTLQDVEHVGRLGGLLAVVLRERELRLVGADLRGGLVGDIHREVPRHRLGLVRDDGAAVLRRSEEVGGVTRSDRTRSGDEAFLAGTEVVYRGDFQDARRRNGGRGRGAGATRFGLALCLCLGIELDLAFHRSVGLDRELDLGLALGPGLSLGQGDDLDVERTGGLARCREARLGAGRAAVDSDRTEDLGLGVPGCLQVPGRGGVLLDLDDRVDDLPVGARLRVHTVVVPLVLRLAVVAAVARRAAVALGEVEERPGMLDMRAALDFNGDTVDELQGTGVPLALLEPERLAAGGAGGEALGVLDSQRLLRAPVLGIGVEPGADVTSLGVGGLGRNGLEVRGDRDVAVAGGRGNGVGLGGTGDGGRRQGEQAQRDDHTGRSAEDALDGGVHCVQLLSPRGVLRV